MLFHVHAASGSAAGAACNTGSAGPVMSKLRTARTDLLSLPLTRKG